MKWRPSMIQCVWKRRKFGDDAEEEYRPAVQVEIAKVQIRLPVETWTEVFAWLDHKMLMERICFTRRLFHAIVRPMLDSTKERALPEMAFVFVQKYEGASGVLVKRVQNGIGHRMVQLPIAEVAPPRNIVGFSLIELRFFNAKVRSFLCAIRPLLSNVWLELDVYTNHSNWQPNADPFDKYQWTYGTNRLNLAVLECLLRVCPRLERSIGTLCIRSGTNLIGTELLDRILANAPHLRINNCKLPTPELSSLTGSYSHNCSPHIIQVLVKWLHSATENGHQKMASLSIGRIENLLVLVEQAQQHFLSADHSAPVPYFVLFHSSPFVTDAQRVQLPFRTLFSERTGEVLTLRHHRVPLIFSGYSHNFVLYRRSCASAATYPSEEAELVSMRLLFERALFPEEPRNKLVLNVAQMSEINESLFALDSESEPEADEHEPGSSN